MKVFVSWSGGKDCTFALYQYLKTHSIDTIECLINMQRSTTQNAHRLSEELIFAQAEAMGIKLIRERLEPGNSYAHHFERVVSELRDQRGVEYGVFGDIYLQVHRDWIEEECRKLKITPIFPIWDMDVHDIYEQFVEAGFKAKVISVQKNDDYEPMLGEYLSMELLEKMKSFSNFDVCGELGEYHSFVMDGPLFKHPVEYRVVEEFVGEKIHALQLDVAL